MENLLIGLGATLLAEGGKRWSRIPLSPENALAIRAVVAVISVVGTVLSAWASGELANLDWKITLDQLGNAITSFATATGIYHFVLKDKK